MVGGIEWSSKMGKAGEGVWGGADKEVRAVAGICQHAWISVRTPWCAGDCGMISGCARLGWAGG